MATRSQLRAYAQSFSAVEVETPSAAAACAAVRPAGKAELDQLGLARVLRFELSEGFVQGE